MELTHVLVRPLVTEKATDLLAENKYSFEVHRDATKIEIRQAVEKLFDVKVQKVWTMNRKGKQRRFGRAVGMTQDWKKAIVLLAEGNTIQIFEGV